MAEASPEVLAPPAVLPLFPLPDQVLLIGVPMPYRLFEPRYRALARHLAQQPAAARWLAVPRLVGAWQQDYRGQPAFADIAAAARVVQLEELPNEQWLLVAEGMVRCRLHEQPSSHLFRLARIDVQAEPLPSTDDHRQAERLRGIIADLARQLGEPGQVLNRALAEPDLRLQIDRLAALLLVETDQRQALLEDARLGERVRRLLRALGRDQSSVTDPSMN
jgi:uncharacterized protein